MRCCVDDIAATSLDIAATSFNIAATSLNISVMSFNIAGTSLLHHYFQNNNQL